ncbi:MAG: hypothetical protein LLG04_12575 [Parachlamydia sp.]|nr:hypothetical protein [Parachlamydia sp.]
MQINRFEHPDPRFQEILHSIEAYPPFYSACLKDLQQCTDRLNFTQTRFALEVILGMAWLEQNAETVAQITDEQQRNDFITKKICLVAEPGLFPGNSQEAVRTSLAMRIDEFKQAYLFDQKRGCTASFFAYAFVGPPCFNGRLITLQEYIVREQQRISTYDFDRKLDYDAEACKLENIIYEFQNVQDSKSLPDIQELQSYLLKSMKDDRVALAKNPQFAEIFRRAKEFASSNL